MHAQMKILIICRKTKNLIKIHSKSIQATPGDRVRGFPPGQLSQLGKYKLVPQLQSWHGKYKHRYKNYNYKYEQKIQIGTIKTEISVYTTKARKEVLDLERDICRSRDISFHVVPYKLKARI